MPFKDTKEGSTHSFNDCCGEPEHNSFVERALEEFDEEFLQYDCATENAHPCHLEKYRKNIKSFLSTKLIELLDLTEGCVPEMSKTYYGCINHRGLNGMNCDVCEDAKIGNATVGGSNACRSQFLQNIKRLRG